MKVFQLLIVKLFSFKVLRIMEDSSVMAIAISLFFNSFEGEIRQTYLSVRNK